MQAVVAGNRFSWQGLTGSLSGSRWPFQLDYPKADDLTTEMQVYIQSVFGEFDYIVSTCGEFGRREAE